MCFSKTPQVSSQAPAAAQTAQAYVSPEADPASPNSTANAATRRKLKIDLNTAPVPGTGLVIPTGIAAG